MSDWLGGTTGPQATRDLILAERVRGTPVFAPDGAQVGVVEDLVLDKETGMAAYVLVSCGGILGLGASLCPVPWALLSFGMRQGGYMLGVPEESLRTAPVYDSSAGLSKDYAERVEAHYARPPEPSAGA